MAELSLLGCNVYLILAQCEQVYLFLALAHLLSLRTSYHLPGTWYQVPGIHTRRKKIGGFQPYKYEYDVDVGIAMDDTLDTWYHLPGTSYSDVLLYLLF